MKKIVKVTLKVAGWIFMAVCIFYGLIAGASVSIFFLPLGVILGAAIGSFSAAVYFGIAYILEDQDSILSRLSNLERMLERSSRIPPSVSPPSQPLAPPRTGVPPHTTSDGGWLCRQCGTKNDAGSQFCKDCGKYK